MITAIVLWVLALVFILVTLKNLILRAIKTRRCTAITNGVISDVKEKVSKKNGVTSREYIPTVTYTVGGTAYSKQLAKAYLAEAYTVGQTVEIMYNPGKPSEINKWGTSNKTDVVMLCIGLLIGVAGVVLLMIK